MRSTGGLAARSLASVIDDEAKFSDALNGIDSRSLGETRLAVQLRALGNSDAR